MSLSPSCVGTSLNRLHQILIDPNSNRVGIFVIVAEERRVVADILTEHFLAFPVLLHGIQHLVHRVTLVLEYMLLESCETVGNGSQTSALDISGVITCTTAVVVLALVDTVIDVEAEESSRCVEREHPFDIVVHAEFQVHEIDHLLVPGIVEFLERLERSRIASLESQLLLRDGVKAVVQGDFQNLRRVEITCQQIGFLAKSTYFDATRASAFAGILHSLAGTHHFLDVGVGIEDRRIAVTLTNHLQTCHQEVVGGILSDMNGEAWLQLVQLLLNLQNHKGNLVGSTASVAFHTTDVDIGEVVVSTALEGCHTHLRRRRLVIELDPQAGNQLLRLVASEGAVSQSLFVEREKMLVDVTRIHRVPSVQLSHCTQVHEPIHLNGFPQVARCMSRHPSAHAGNLLQLSLALWVLLFCSHLLRQFRMPLSKEDGGITADGHSLQLLLLVRSFRVVDIIQFADLLFDASLHVEQAFAVHPSVHRRMTSSTLFHELREDTCMISLLPLLRHMIEDALTLRLASPVRDDLAFIRVDVSLRDVVTLQFASIERVEVLNAVASQFRKSRNSLWHRSAFTHNQFILTDIESFLLADFIEVLGSQHSDGHRSVVLLVELRFDECPFDAQRRRGIEILLAQSFDALVHSAFISRILNGKVAHIFIVSYWRF